MAVAGWFRRNANTILVVVNLGLIAVLLGAALFWYYHSVWSFQGKEPLRHAIQKSIDIYSLGSRLDKYNSRYGTHPCASGTLPCDWQEELTKVDPDEPIPTNPETSQPYVYLTDGQISAVAAPMYRAPFSTICEKQGGEIMSLVYYNGSEVATVVCGTANGRNLLRADP